MFGTTITNVWRVLRSKINLLRDFLCLINSVLSYLTSFNIYNLAKVYLSRFVTLPINLLNNFD